MFFHEFDADAALREGLHDPPQIIEVAREAIHTMGDDRVALTNKVHQRFNLWTFSVFAGGFVRKDPIDGRARKLSLGVLLQATYAYVANALPDHA